MVDNKTFVPPTIPEFPELTFDEAPHIYRLNGLEVPSVTTLMKPLSAAVYGDVDEWVMERAAGRGTAVHNSIENLVAYGIEDIAPEFRGYFDGFLSWVTEMKPEVLGTECRLYHKILRYAGTADLPCIINGKKTMVDVKTTAQLQEMLARVQLEAYVKGFDSHGVAFEKKAILHLRRDGTYKFELYPLRDPEAWTTFAALLTVNSYTQKFKTGGYR